MRKKSQEKRNQGESRLKGNQRVQNKSQLMKDLITDTEEEDNKQELTQDKATGFLDQEELEFLRQYQTLFGMIRSEVRKLPINKNDWEKSHLRNKFIRDMKFLTQTSKSKGGVAMKLLKTEKVQQSQQLYEKRGVEGENQDIVDRVMDAVSGSGGSGGKDIVGSVDTGEYTGGNKSKW